jgi:hypothetical protein
MYICATCREEFETRCCTGFFCSPVCYDMFLTYIDLNEMEW